MENQTPILSARNLHICFNLRGRVLHAIRGIDLDICKGEVLAIVGESGSGKSVFTKSFMGLLDANGSITEGTIDYFGADDGKPVRLSALKKEKDWLKIRGHEIAMIMQDPMTSLNPLKTIGDQIAEAVEIHQHLKGRAAREKAHEIVRRAEERSKNMVNVTNEYTEDALRRTEDAIQMALDEIRESRARFRAVSNEQLQAQRAKLEAQNSESDKKQQ